MTPTRLNPALLGKLAKRIGKKPQYVREQISRRATRQGIASEAAQILWAKEYGIGTAAFQRQLDPHVQEQVRTGVSKPSERAKGKGKGVGKAPATRVINFSAARLKTSDPFLQAEKLKEASEMAAVYPVLYVLENSIRTVIRTVMEAKFGADWWNTALTSAKALQMKNIIESRLNREDENSWHQRRGAHNIDYSDLTHLLVIAQSKTSLFFPRVLGTEKWFESLIDEVSPSRNVLCHMNALLTQNANAIGVRLGQWHNHLKSREAEILAAMTPAPGPAGRPTS